MPTKAMVIVGGGSSSRFGSDKLLADINGRPLVQVTVEAVTPHVDRCVLVVREDSTDRFAELGLPVSVVAGGPTRTKSEMSGLAAIMDLYDLIGIHDAARPLVTPNMLNDLFAMADMFGGAVPLQETDDLFVSKDTLQPISRVHRAQTPQVFRSELLLSAYELAAEAGLDAYDTAEVVGRISDARIGWLPGDPDNLKVTFPSDLELVRAASRT